MDINVSELNTEEIKEFMSSLIKDLVTGSDDPGILFFTIQDLIQRLSLEKRYITYLRLNLAEGYNLDVKIVEDKPEDWDFQFIRDFLRDSFDSLKLQNLIIYGFDLEYNRPYAGLYVGFFKGEKTMCLDFKKAEKDYEDIG